MEGKVIVMRKTFVLFAIFCSFVLMLGCGRNPITGNPSQSGGVIEVTVIDGSDPVAGVQVQLTDAENNTVDEQVTDEEGVAVFEGLASGNNYSAVAEKGGVTGSATNLQVSASEKTIAQITLNADGQGGVITGTVKVYNTDRPVAGAKVQLVSGSLSASTDASGHFTLNGVPSGSQKLKITCSGYNDTARDVVIKENGSVPVVVEMYPVTAGPRAGHTLVTTAARVLEIDTWHSVTAEYAAKNASMARFVRQNSNVLVADCEANQVLEYNQQSIVLRKYTGKTALFFGGIDQPRGVSRTNNGNVLVADTNNNRIVEIDANNRKVWSYETRLNAPSYAERLSNGNTLIVDSGNNRVLEITSNGTVVWACGNGTSGVLNNPTFATRLANGNTLITDTGNNRVMEVTNGNKYTWMYGGQEDGGQLANPASATRLPNGNTLIADTGNDRVIEIDAEGNIQWDMPVGQPLFAERI